MILDNQLNNMKKITEEKQYNANLDLYRDWRKSRQLKKAQSVAIPIDFSMVSNETDADVPEVEEVDTSVSQSSESESSEPESEIKTEN